MEDSTNGVDFPTPGDEPSAEIAPDADARMWAALCHLAAFSMYFTGVGFIIGPLIVWLLRKDVHPFIDDQGKESLNFEISILIYYTISGVAIFCVIGVPMLIILHVLHLVFIIIAAVKANSGERYRYPLTIRLVK